MAGVMLATYPEVFAAGAIIAGLPYGTAGNVQQAFESMFQGRPRAANDWGDLVRNASPHQGPWPRVSVWHGDADATVIPMNAEGIVRQWTNLHGIDAAPRRDVVDGYPRRVWRRDGIDLVEAYTITGMAHGAPLATGKSDTACGKAGAFLLEVGISSSHHIATFFGLTGRGALYREKSVIEAAIPAFAPAVSSRVEVIPDERVEILEENADEPHFGDANPDRVDVMAIITKALTSAGLMKPPR
jgi:feruloyl esterase